MEFMLEGVSVVGRQEVEIKGRTYYRVLVESYKGVVVSLKTTKKHYEALEFGAPIDAFVSYDEPDGPEWTLEFFRDLTADLDE